MQFVARTLCVSWCLVAIIASPALADAPISVAVDASGGFQLTLHDRGGVGRGQSLHAGPHQTVRFQPMRSETDSYVLRATNGKLTCDTSRTPVKPGSAFRLIVTPTGCRLVRA